MWFLVEWFLVEFNLVYYFFALFTNISTLEYVTKVEIKQQTKLQKWWKANVRRSSWSLPRAIKYNFLKHEGKQNANRLYKWYI